MPFSGYTSVEVATLLGRTRAALQSSGVLSQLGKSFPFGNHQLPLYSIEDVDRWALAIARYDGLVALGQMARQTPLMVAIQLSTQRDTVCSSCGGMAVRDSDDPVGARQFWCRACGVLPVQHGEKDQPHERPDA